jgi:putative transposon-encoded protein
MRSSRSKYDHLFHWALVVFAFVVLPFGAIFARCYVPCSYVGWMAATEVPARCLPGAPK